MPNPDDGAFRRGADMPVDDRTVDQLIEAQAARTPDAPAITCDGLTLTYRQVDRRANEVAAQLAARGVGKGDLVPLVMAGGAEVPIAMIAAMKLGAPFVPMDIAWPEARISRLLTAMAPKVVAFAGGEPPAAANEVLSFSAASLPERDRSALGPPPNPDDLAYGFYTSGSTGEPKCALNIHRGLRNRFAVMDRRFLGPSGEVVLQISTHVFDPSLWQLLWPLTHGSRTVIPGSSGLVDIPTILDLVERHQITITDLVPSVFNVLVEVLSAEPAAVARLGSLRNLLIGGEEMQAAAVQRFRAVAPQVRITNTYGPTEAAIGMIFHEVTDADTPEVPIGLPIENTCAVIVDDDMAPVAPAVVGNLYIGGDCLGHGYLNDPVKTAAAFIHNPFAELPTDRLYRTGDLAFLRDDGLLGFRGRHDDQVKIAGLRVELGEIETALRAHPKVTDAKVVVHTEAEDKRLIAFVTGQDGLRSAEILSHLRAVLPAYFVPARVAVLDAMPLMPNGKLDRAALIRMAGSAATIDGPLTATERTLAEIWTEFLPAGAIMRTDNFFRLGGDSLGAQRMVLAVKERLGVEISVRDVVRAPDLSGLAAWIYGSAPPVSRDPGPDPGLPDDIRTVEVPRSGSPAHVLLTGATGFVGVHLLQQLLTQTTATVHCLLRSRDIASGRRRLSEALATYGLLAGTELDRVRVVPGDLARPGLGLDSQTQGILAETVDTIVHCGAVVNLVLDYSFHQAANVAGTLEILRMAVGGRLKPVHYISTLSVLGAHRRAGRTPVPEQALDDDRPDDGYSLSKWAGERLVLAAADRGVPVAVYRIGEVMPHSVIGRPSSASLVDSLIRACLRLGVTPTGLSAVSYTPVDALGHTIAAAVRRGARGIFHMLPPQPIGFDELLGRFGREFGLRSVGYREFWTLLDAAARADTGDEEHIRLLAALPPARATVSDDALAGELGELFQDCTGVFATDRADALRAATGTMWPVVDDEVLGRYTAFHRRALVARLPALVGGHAEVDKC